MVAFSPRPRVANRNNNNPTNQNNNIGFRCAGTEFLHGDVRAWPESPGALPVERAQSVLAPFPGRSYRSL